MLQDKEPSYYCDIFGLKNITAPNTKLWKIILTHVYFCIISETKNFCFDSRKRIDSQLIWQHMTAPIGNKFSHSLFSFLPPLLIDLKYGDNA